MNDEDRLQVAVEEGVVFWVPAEPFTVDGIRYNVSGGCRCYLQPMIALKGQNDHTDPDFGGWDSPHLSSAASLAEHSDFPQWRGVTWDPDIRF